MGAAFGSPFVRLPVRFAKCKQNMHLKIALMPEWHHMLVVVISLLLSDVRYTQSSIPYQNKGKAQYAMRFSWRPT